MTLFNCEHKHVFYSILMQMDRFWHIQHFTVMLKTTVIPFWLVVTSISKVRALRVIESEKEQRLKKNHSHGGCHLQRQSNYVTHGNKPVCVCGKACVMRNCSISKKKKKKNEINGWTSLSVKVRTRSTDSLLKRECTRAETYWGYAYRRHI